MNVRENLIEERARSRVGTTLRDKYRLDRLLGVGGMAAVYSATHRNAKRFAVKVLHAELSLHEDTRRRFLREGYVANSVGHPGAVAVLDDDVSDDGAAFLVMELLDGASVDVVCKANGGKLPLDGVLAIAEQLLDVLAAADAHAIVHRDIKPANLFVTRDGHVKVLDFGVARLRESEAAGTSTHTGMTLGTPAYMAPEQALGHSDDITGRTDIWAVGATMFALLTGRAVHEARSAPEQLVFAATKPAQPLAEVAPDVPAGVCAIVDKALAFAPNDRWESAAAMRDAVRAARTGDGAPLASLMKSVPSERSLPVATGPIASTAAPVSPISPKASTVGEPTPGATAAPPEKARRSGRGVLVVAVVAAIAVGIGIGAMRSRNEAATAGASAVVRTSAGAPEGASATASAVAPPSASASMSAAPSATPPRAAHAVVRPIATAASPPPASAASSAKPLPHDSFDHQ